jgi:L-cysteine desulfidase
MSDIFKIKKKHTYIIKTLEDLESVINSQGYSFKKIDSKTCEITAEEDLSVTDIIEKLRSININVVNIISKRNRLEELFLDLTKEELS